MKKQNNFLILIFILFSTLFCASGEFSGWGNTILHHVADSKTVNYYGLPISKHVIMLLISAIFTLLISLLATKKYRQNINAKPKGLSQIFEILMDFIKMNVLIFHHLSTEICLKKRCLF